MVDFKKILLRYYTNIVFLSRTVLLAIVVLLALDLVGILNLDRIIDYEVLFIIGVVSISIPIALYFEKEGKDEQRMKFEKYFLFFFILGIVLTILASLEYNILKEFDVYIAILTVACGFFTAYFNSERIQNQFEDETSSNFLKTASYLLPVIIVASIFYINFHSFTTDEKLTLDVGNPDDTSGDFYIKGDGLGPRQEIDGNYFRDIDGSAYAVYEPDRPIEDAEVKITWEGENLEYPTMPSTDFDWDYEWDTNNIMDDFEIDRVLFELEDFKEGGIKTDNPDYSEPFAIFFEWEAQEHKVLAEGDISLVQDSQNITLEAENFRKNYSMGNYSLGEEHSAIIAFDGDRIYFFIEDEEVNNFSLREEITELNTYNSKIKQFEEERFKKEISKENDCFYLKNTRLRYPNSSNMFEEGPWAVYIEWIPEKQANTQQIIGHYNWEIYQSSENVTFRIGDMSLAGSKRYLLEYKIGEEFFGQNNKLLAIYNPNPGYSRKLNNTEGNILFFVNGKFVGRNTFSDDTISIGYGRNLTIGNTKHSGGNDVFYEGEICEAKFSYNNIDTKNLNTLRQDISKDDKIHFALPIGRLDKIEIEIIKE